MAEEVSRDEKLAHFEAATGITDIDECLGILESCSWDLQVAINCAIGGNTQSHSENREPIEDGSDSELAAPLQHNVHIPEHNGEILNTSNDASGSTENNRPKRMLEFKVHYGNRSFTITLSDRDTIRILKQQVYAQTNVAPEKQVLICDALHASAFPQNFPGDNVILGSLHLPKYNTCQLHAETPATSSRSNTASISASASASSSRVGTSASNVATRTTVAPNMPIRLEPSDCVAVDESNDAAEALLSGSNGARVRQNVGEGGDSEADMNDSDADESGEQGDDDLASGMDYYDADDTGLPNDDTTRKRQFAERLMPAGVTDEYAAVENFVRVFEQRYSIRSIFHVSTLADAVHRAYIGPVDARRPLALYLHHDLSVFAHLFCSDVLSRPAVNDLLRNRFYVVPGDVTLRDQRDRIINLLLPHLGSFVTSRFRVAAHDQFPLLLVLGRNGGTLEVQRVFLASTVHAPQNIDDFIAFLTAARSQFDEGIAGHRELEMQRAQREATRREQDAAYNQSVAQDTQRLAAIAAADRARADALASELEAKKVRERRLATARERLPPEPRAEEPNCVTVKFRHPEGVLTRRFERSAVLQAVVDYLVIEGFFVPEEYRACFGFPKRFFAQNDFGKTLAELKFTAQELITLEHV